MSNAQHDPECQGDTRSQPPVCCKSPAGTSDASTEIVARGSAASHREDGCRGQTPASARLGLNPASSMSNHLHVTKACGRWTFRKISLLSWYRSCMTMMVGPLQQTTLLPYGTPRRVKSRTPTLPGARQILRYRGKAETGAATCPLHAQPRPVPGSGASTHHCRTGR